jgi:hypothetical protein
MIFGSPIAKISAAQKAGRTVRMHIVAFAGFLLTIATRLVHLVFIWRLAEPAIPRQACFIFAVASTVALFSERVTTALYHVILLHSFGWQRMIMCGICL